MSSLGKRPFDQGDQRTHLQRAGRGRGNAAGGDFAAYRYREHEERRTLSERGRPTSPPDLLRHSQALSEGGVADAPQPSHTDASVHSLQLPDKKSPLELRLQLEHDSTGHLTSDSESKLADVIKQQEQQATKKIQMLLSNMDIVLLNQIKTVLVLRENMIGISIDDKIEQKRSLENTISQHTRFNRTINSNRFSIRKQIEDKQKDIDNPSRHQALFPHLSSDLQTRLTTKYKEEKSKLEEEDRKLALHIKDITKLEDKIKKIQEDIAFIKIQSGKFDSALSVIYDIYEEHKPNIQIEGIDQFLRDRNQRLIPVSGIGNDCMIRALLSSAEHNPHSTNFEQIVTDARQFAVDHYVTTQHDLLNAGDEDGQLIIAHLRSRNLLDSRRGVTVYSWNQQHSRVDPNQVALGNGDPNLPDYSIFLDVQGIHFYGIGNIEHISSQGSESPYVPHDDAQTHFGGSDLAGSSISRESEAQYPMLYKVLRDTEALQKNATKLNQLAIEALSPGDRETFERETEQYRRHQEGPLSFLRQSELDYPMLRDVRQNTEDLQKNATKLKRLVIEALSPGDRETFEREMKQYRQTRTRTELLENAQINIWQGALSEEEVVHLMKTDQIKSSDILNPYPDDDPEELDLTELPKKITLNSGITGIFKAASIDHIHHHHHHTTLSSYRHEIAAYELDKLLGLEMVPLTVEREISGEKGSFQLWVNNLERLETPPNNNATFFDKLIYNPDRTNNVGLLGDQTILYDNAISFPSTKHDLLPSDSDPSQYIPEQPDILQKARELDREKLEQIKYLTPLEKDCLLDRRDKLIQAIENSKEHS